MGDDRLETLGTSISRVMSSLQCTVVPEEYVAQGESGTFVMLVLAVLFFVFDAAVVGVVILYSKAGQPGKLKAN